MTDYNGWTNYATWRINLEIFDGQNAKDLGIHRMDEYEAAQYLKSYVEEILEEQGKGLALDYAMAFLSEVNWREIAKHLLDDYQAEQAA